MRVALCISGQPRNVYRGFENILQNMKFDFEVFVHSWWDNKSNQNTFKKILYDGREDEVSEIVDNDWIGKLYGSFNVNKVLIEKQKHFDIPEVFEKRKLKFTHTFGVYSSLYSVYRCNKLKRNFELDNGFTYDWVIRTRPDFGLSEPLTLDGLDESIIYAPNDNSHNYGFSDQFAIGSSKNMDVYSGVFPIIENVIESHKSGIYTASYCDKPDNMGHEQIVQRHLENSKIKFELLDLKNFLFRDEDKRTRIHSIED
jgi:hypothetical protein